jgi:HPt (histidine-containing phosphotransfer) domain-containing protein
VSEQKQGVSGSIQEIITTGPERYDARCKALKREGFDPESLWDRIDGDVDLLRDLIGIFAKEYPGILLRIESAISQGEGNELQKASHKLKGSVLQFSASAAAAAAANLEEMGRKGSLEGAGAHLAKLKNEVGSLMESLNTMIQRGSAQ